MEKVLSTELNKDLSNKRKSYVLRLILPVRWRKFQIINKANFFSQKYEALMIAYNLLQKRTIYLVIKN
ncbi:MAG: hypothetical protein KAW19_11340 [Candidatus Aminicenantes bacterium]|nr:hypothetical protein [Candidatus Aminicenantes bacterium]